MKRCTGEIEWWGGRSALRAEAFQCVLPEWHEGPCRYRQDNHSRAAWAEATRIDQAFARVRWEYRAHERCWIIMLDGEEIHRMDEWHEGAELIISPQEEDRIRARVRDHLRKTGQI